VYIPLSYFIFLQNLAWKKAQVHTLMPNFTAVTLKCGLIALEIGNF